MIAKGEHLIFRNPSRFLSLRMPALRFTFEPRDIASLTRFTLSR